MRKLIFLLLTITLVVGLGVFAFSQDPAPIPSGEDFDVNKEKTTGGIGGASTAIPVEAFRNKNQLLIDFTNFQKEGGLLDKAKDLGYYSAGDELRDPKVFPKPGDKDTAGNPTVEESGDNGLPETYGEEGTLEPLYKVTVNDMKYQNWIVELNSSADKVENRLASYCKAVLRESGEEVLGVRVHFPDTQFNSWARVRPPFVIKAFRSGEVTDPQHLKPYNPRFKDVGGIPANYANTYTDELDHAGYGVIDNVGQIKQLSIEAYGLNQNVGLAVLLNDQFEEATEYFMGYLNFPGWRRLFWNNPNYITNIDHRNIFKLPLYPVEKPIIRFDSLKLYRQGGEKVVNFISYFRNIKISYDFAVPPEAEKDIDHELKWEILRRKYIARAKFEERNARELLYLRKQERARLGANEKPKDFVEPNSKW